MRYIGNKSKLLNFIEQTVRDTCSNLDNKIFCDIFAGSGTVSAHFKPLVKTVISNDMEKYSNVLCTNILSSISEEIADRIITELNALSPIASRFTNDFSPVGSRSFFTEDNAKKIDAIRLKIEELPDNEKVFALACLLETADSLANTTGVYGAFLKKFDKKSKQDLILKKILPPSGNEGIAYCEDANKLIKKIKGDILYMDPPYNSRQYGSNYHILNYLVDYNSYSFKESSKTGIGDYNKSNFCSKKSALSSFEDIIANANFNYIFVSYNNEGIIKPSDFKEVMTKYGEYSFVTNNHKRYKSNNRNEQKTEVSEYIHILRKK